MTISNVSELDFFTVKENLKNYLRDQQQFNTYDFDGSGLNLILDILAYNTHYNAVHTNLAFSENYLDSANQRASVVSRAKELGYIPNSKSSAEAIINVSFSVAGNPNQYTIPKGTKFNSSAGGETFSFVTTRDHIINNNGSNVFSDSISVRQGKYATISYTVDREDLSQRYILGSQNADTDFLTVFVKDTEAAPIGSEYQYFQNISLGDFSPETEVYFIKETLDGYYEIYFGDGVIGKALENGNFIQLTYLITNGKDANGAKVFTLGSTLTNVSSVSITTVQSAVGGKDRESVDSIKFLAPFYYQSQGRAVTKDDYKALLKQNYSDIDDLTVWGGEENDPPFYGKVFIAIKPKSATVFSNAQKSVIKSDIVNRFNILSIRPEIVDPDYINVDLNVVCTYNARLYTGTNTETLETGIRNAINTFFENEANKFGKPLYYSKLVNAIDSSSQLILNSVVNLVLKKSKEIFSGISAEYKFSFNNSLHPGSITSNQFVINGETYRIRDIPSGQGPHSNGNIAIYRTTNLGTTVYLTRTAGTINYNTGEIVLTNVNIDSIVGDSVNRRLVVSVSPGAFADVNNPTTVYTDYNVFTNERDQIITLSENGVNVTLLPDESV